MDRNADHEAFDTDGCLGSFLNYLTWSLAEFMSITTKDPFAFKTRSKLDPVRLLFTAQARIEEWVSRRRFASYQIPLKSAKSVANPVPEYNQAETAVTPEQMEALLAAIHETNQLSAPIVEVGAFRGISTALMAGATSRQVHAVDPYAGYGGADGDYRAFQDRTGNFANVIHLRETSGEASFRPGLAAISFAFIDAVHDYVNARFDGLTWSMKLTEGGMIAFHDTDAECFPGVMRAVCELLKESNGTLSLHAHVTGLVVLKRS